MTLLLTLAGLTILAATVVDLYATVMKPGGGGAMGTRVAATIWAVGLAIHRRRFGHRFLSNIGVAAVVSVPLAWMLLMWLGWSLLYLGTNESVLDSADRQPADAWSRVYFAGYSLFTSGLGDKVPNGALWQMMTVLTSFMGLGLVTLAITFLVPILQAATERRALARSLSHLGHTTQGILERCWHDHHRLADVAPDLATQCATMTEKHLSYPVLEHLHSATAAAAFTPRLAALHDATTIAILDANTEEAAALQHLRTAIADHADLLCSRRPARVSTEPPPISTELGQEAVERLESVAHVRCQIDALVRHDGWTWDDVTKRKADASTG